jgi:phosphocarrier protein
VARDLQQEGPARARVAKFVQTVEKFDADVKVKRGSEDVGGTSIMGLMMLAAGPGTTITIEASGTEAAR